MRSPAFTKKEEANTKKERTNKQAKRLMPNVEVKTQKELIHYSSRGRYRKRPKRGRVKKKGHLEKTAEKRRVRGLSHRTENTYINSEKQENMTRVNASGVGRD